MRHHPYRTCMDRPPCLSMLGRVSTIPGNHRGSPLRIIKLSTPQGFPAYSLIGGGGSNSINMMPPADDNPPTPVAGGETQAAFSEARSVNTQVETFSTLAQGADTLPQVFRASYNTVFGSVAQAITAGLSDVSGVDTSFTGDRFTLEIERRDGNNIGLDTDRDAVSIVNSYTPSENR